MNEEQRSHRCVVCRWTINPNRVEIVQRGDDVLYLHRGGCPRPDPIKEPK